MGRVGQRIAGVGGDRNIEGLEVGGRGREDVGHLQQAQLAAGRAAVAGLFHKIHGVGRRGAVHVHGRDVLIHDLGAVPAWQVNAMNHERGARAEDSALLDGQHLDVIEQALAADREGEHVEGEHVGVAGRAIAVEVGPERAAGIGRSGGRALGDVDLPGQEVGSLGRMVVGRDGEIEVRP